MSGAEVRRIALGVDHVEGLAISPAGVVWCGGEEGEVYNVALDGSYEIVAHLPGTILGVALDGRDRAYCAVLGEHAGLYRAERDGTVALVSAGTPDRPARNPNHPLFLPDGTLLFTESGDFDADDGCIFAVDPDGRTRVVDATSRRFPNGLARHPDTGAIHIVESTLPGIAVYDVARDGGLTGRRVACLLPHTVPDGVAFDARGRMLVSCWAPDVVLLVDGPSIATLAEDPRRQMLISPANVAFVPGTSTVVATNAGSRFLSVFEHDTPGAPLVRPERAA